MINTLPSITDRAQKRLGRGHGSGRGKTSGRGQKGQKARGTIPPQFEGGQLSVLKRLPLLRGKGRNKATSAKPHIITTDTLSKFAENARVTVESLKKEGIVPDETVSVKILAGGGVSKKLTVSVPCSASARAIIEKAGGSVA